MIRPARLAFFAGIVSIVVAGCVIVPADLPEARYTAALVGAEVRTDTAGFPQKVWRVEVRTDSTTDTIPAVWTYTPVAVVRRVGIVGVAWDTAGGGVKKGFRYDPAKRRVHDVTLAPDMTGYRAVPALSPDGQHVAYVATRGGRSRAVVRMWPRGRVLVSGPEIAERPAGPVLHHAGWTSPDSFDVRLDLSERPARYLRVRGSVRGDGIAVDTVALAPVDSV